jgi:hypothetical protein
MIGVMPSRLATVTLASALRLLAFATPLHAECIGLDANGLIERDVFEVVFSGTVQAIERIAPAGIRVTFDVERVWKGSLPRQFSLYV